MTAPLLIMAMLATAQWVTFANPGNTFSAPYRLVVHSQNQDRTVSRIKTLEVLFNYFKEAKAKPLSVSYRFRDLLPSYGGYPYAARACQLQLLDCSAKFFRPHRPVSQNEFIDWFFRLKHLADPHALELRYPNINKAATRAWLEAKRLNLVLGESLTYESLQEFLYRHSVSEANAGLPYNPALVIDSSEINPQNYHNLMEIDLLQENLDQIIKELESDPKPSPDSVRLAKKLKSDRVSFVRLRSSLMENPYLLTERGDLDSQVATLVQRFGIQEVLYSYTYDYSQNAAYRKHNLVTGAKRLQAKLLMPNEILDFWQILTSKGMWDFKYGWVIADGEEQWQFGGGICGSATLAFIPMWKSGLEVIERRNHSAFYSDLYPRENIGLDATVYRPKPNLRLKNNLGTPIVFNVINDTQKQTITIEILGNRTYKAVNVEGPIFTGRNAVKWVRQIEQFDGSIVSDSIESRYNVIF